MRFPGNPDTKFLGRLGTRLSGSALPDEQPDGARGGKAEGHGR